MQGTLLYELCLPGLGWRDDPRHDTPQLGLATAPLPLSPAGGGVDGDSGGLIAKALLSLWRCGVTGNRARLADLIYQLHRGARVRELLLQERRKGETHATRTPSRQDSGFDRLLISGELVAD